MLKFKVILNPIAGKGKAFTHIPLIEKELARLRVNYELVLTQGVWDAAELASQAQDEGFRVVVAAGGDGTCNEVINGLLWCKEKSGKAPILGVLPIGRGNDFSYGAAVPSSIHAACEILAAGYQQFLDIGLIKGGFFPEGRYFGNGIGIGFDTIVGLEAANMNYLHGLTAYLVGALKTFMLYPAPVNVEINTANSIDYVETQQISILNGRRMGGTFYMAPEGDNNDGLFDLCMLTRKISRWEMARLFVRYIKGTQAMSPAIKTDRNDKFWLLAPAGGMVCHADGETICTNGRELEIICIPRALQILCSPELKKKQTTK